jgi:hypothetical protein
LLTKQPNLQSVPKLSFTEKQIQEKISCSERIVTVVTEKFRPRYKSLFSDEVMRNWSEWLSSRKAVFFTMLNHDNKNNVDKLELPEPFQKRQRLSDSPQTSVQDFASADIPDAIEYVTHQSASHGAFSLQDREELIRRKLFWRTKLVFTSMSLMGNLISHSEK